MVAPERLHGVTPTQLLTLVLGRHRILDESGELVEDVVPSQTRLPVLRDQAGEPAGMWALLRAAGAGRLVCCLPAAPPACPAPLWPLALSLRAALATDLGGGSLSSRKSSMVTVSVLESPL